MRAQYVRLMDALHRVCLIIASACLVIITLIIPYGVFTRYVLTSAASWPEPIATLLMIIMSFFAAIVCYREYLHIGVGILPTVLKGNTRLALGWIIEMCMLATNLFMLVYGIKLVEATWYQWIPELPIMSVGLSYAPIPIGGGVTILFIIERIWTQQFFQEPDAETISTLTTE
jgi:TRAP-type C4-dicarboxylate transport system permease small subunit